MFKNKYAHGKRFFLSVLSVYLVSAFAQAAMLKNIQPRIQTKASDII
jgi:hypothetical protein